MHLTQGTQLLFGLLSSTVLLAPFLGLVVQTWLAQGYSKGKIRNRNHIE